MHAMLFRLTNAGSLNDSLKHSDKSNKNRIWCHCATAKTKEEQFVCYAIFIVFAYFKVKISCKHLLF